MSAPRGILWDHDADPGTAEVGQWTSLVSAVKGATAAFNTRVDLGVTLFPSVEATSAYNAAACPVGPTPEVPVAPNNAGAISGALDAASATTIAGGRPTSGGVTTALEGLKDLDAAKGRALVLVTGGAANCALDATSPSELLEEYDEQLPVLVGAALTDLGIPTYVVGVNVADELTADRADGQPNSTNAHTGLNATAEAGGRAQSGEAKFFQTENEEQLRGALEQILADVLSCVVPLPTTPAFPDLLEVSVGGAQVPRVTDCATQDGWAYAAGTNDAIALCGQWCADLKSKGSANADYYCVTR